MATGSKELVARLNTMVAQVVSTKRKLQREIKRLSQRASAAKATKAVKRPSRPAARPAPPIKKKKAAAPKRGLKTKKTTRARGRRR